MSIIGLFILFNLRILCILYLGQKLFALYGYQNAIRKIASSGERN